MKTNRTLFLLCAALTLSMIGRSAPACGGYVDLILRDLARQAVSEDDPTAAAARNHLRAYGPIGLQMFESVHRRDLAAYHEHLLAGITNADPADDRCWSRLRAALDAIGAQRDNFAAPLYWYTDLEQAKTAAATQDRPILSLRLLGRLDEEYSCGNSRFFRTALYANDAVARTLRSRFVLHWESVRPVPKITIDFGSGRRIERTITGNSAHLVLDAKGRPVDVIPGLYGPQAFIAALTQAEAIAAETVVLENAPREARLRDLHRQLADASRHAWARDLVRIGAEIPVEFSPAARSDDAQPAPPAVLPGAVRAMPIAITKRVVEIPMLAAIMPEASVLEAASNDDAWTRIAGLHAGRARLDGGSRMVMMKKMKPAGAGSPDATIERFEAAIALDTVRNEYELHRVIHAWFAGGTAPADASALTARLYDELFLTPGSDPWLGLVPKNVYSALDGDGLVWN